MTYSAIDALTNDTLFAGRVRACCVEQAETFKDDNRKDIAALARDYLRGGPAYLTFVRYTAAAPGIADTATSAGQIDQTRVLDPAILSTVQAAWPTVAALLYTPEGDPLV